MALITRLPRIEALLTGWRDDLGRDGTAYRNHVYRVLNLTLAHLQTENDETVDVVAIAAAFHDIGIWTDHTFDYIEPSIALAQAWLLGQGLDSQFPVVSEMIRWHHKITPWSGPEGNPGGYRALRAGGFRRAAKCHLRRIRGVSTHGTGRECNEKGPSRHPEGTGDSMPDTLLVEAFRRADWLDVCLFSLPTRLPRPFLREVVTAFPRAGFHRRLTELTLGWAPRHPLNPLPMFRW